MRTLYFCVSALVLCALGSQSQAWDSKGQRLLIKAPKPSSRKGDFLPSQAVGQLALTLPVAGNAIPEVRDAQAKFFDYSSLKETSVLFCADTTVPGVSLEKLKKQLIWMFEYSGYSFSLSREHWDSDAQWRNSLVIESGTCDSLSGGKEVFSSAPPR